MFIRRLIGAATVVAALTASVGIGAAADKVSFIRSTDSFAFLPLYVTDVMGRFKEEGIDDQQLRAAGGSTALASVIAGSADIFIGSTASALQAQTQGADIVILGALVNQQSSNVVISGEWAKQHNVTSQSSYQDKLKALKGARFGISAPGSGTDQMIRYLSAEAKINPDREMTLVALGNTDSTMYAALQQKRIDGFVYSDPASHYAVRELGAVMLFNTGIGEVKSLDGFFYIGVMARRDWVKSHEDATVRILRAFQKGLNDVHDPKRTNEARDKVHAKYHPKLPPDLYADVWKDQIKASPTTVFYTRDKLDAVLGLENKFATKKIDPSYIDKVFLNEYAKKAEAAK
jgi:NitT/TauT family transport system substrate-binding protein